jgi:hypothetical protein
MRVTLIRPGLLVSLKTTVHGGVSYQKRTLEVDGIEREGNTRVARWETTRQIEDAVEHEAAVTARSKARHAILRICCKSSLGLLCPESKETELSEAIEEAQRIASEHNKKARFTRVDVFVLTGRIADNDEQAARAIGSEVRDLIAAMEAGVRAADPDAIRDAANRARAMAGMLSRDVQKKVSDAIAEVRAVAKDIVRRVDTTGSLAADVVDGLKLKALQTARFAVLDLTGESEMVEQVRSEIASRAIDLELQEALREPVSAPAVEQRAIEFF